MTIIWVNVLPGATVTWRALESKEAGMAVNRACYCTRQDVITAPDVPLTAPQILMVDSGMEAGADETDRITKRRFWNGLETNKINWPNFQRAYPWRVWFNARELADSDGSGYLATAPVVTTGGTVITASEIMWGPWDELPAPPFRWLELDRSTSAAFGLGTTPQQDLVITGAFGYWMKTRSAGTLAAAVSDTTGTTVTVSDSSVAGVGDVLVSGTEQLLVRDADFADTSVVGSGCTTAFANDNVLTVPDGTAFSKGEVIQVDAEQMYVRSITGNAMSVIRAYGATTLAEHGALEIYAQRKLTVERGFGGTTAATAASGAALSACLVPAMIREYNIAEALNYVYQRTSAYARTIGENARIVPGGSLPDLRKRLFASQYTRGNRIMGV